MTYFKSIKTDKYYRIDRSGKRALVLVPDGFWKRTHFRPADLTGYPFIAVKGIKDV